MDGPYRERGSLSTLLTALTLLCAHPGAMSGASGDADWPQFLGPQRDGVYRGAYVPYGWPNGGPARVWERPVGAGFSGPAVDGGKLILFHRIGDDEVVEAIDPDTAESLWTLRYPTTYRDDFGFDDGPRATPTVADGRVFTFGASGVLHAIDLETGGKLWGVDTGGRFEVRKGYFGVAGSPLVHDGRVLLNVGGRNGAGIVALDAATGELLWKATDDEASYASPVAATFGEHDRILFFTRGGLVGVDPDKGEVRFAFPFRSRLRASVNAATPLVVDDNVFLSASYGTGAVLVDVADDDPRPVWSSNDALSNHYATSVYRQGHLYGVHGRQETGPALRCVEFNTGRVVWSEDRFGAATVLLSVDRLILVKEDGELVVAAATPKGFRPLRRAKILDGVVRAYPALAGGRLYVRNEDRLAAFDLRVGQDEVSGLQIGR